MRSKVVVGMALVGVLASAASAQAKTRVLDGKTTKKISIVTEIPAGAKAMSSPSDAQVLACKEKVDCSRLDFVYRPARGVKGDLTVFTKWYFPTTTDVDLYLVTKGKIVSRCAGQLGNERFLQVPRSAMTSRANYTAIAYYLRSSGESLTLEVDMPSVTINTVNNEDAYNHRVALCS